MFLPKAALDQYPHARLFLLTDERGRRYFSVGELSPEDTQKHLQGVLTTMPALVWVSMDKAVNQGVTRDDLQGISAEPQGQLEETGNDNESAQRDTSDAQPERDPDAVPGDDLRRPAGDGAGSGGETGRDSVNEGRSEPVGPEAEPGQPLSEQGNTDRAGERKKPRKASAPALTLDEIVLPDIEYDYSGRLTPEILAPERSPKQKAVDNIAAILISKSVNNPLDLTDQQRTLLARYSGWGGIPQAFRSPDGSIAKGWETIVTSLESLLPAPDLDAARLSTLDAHYTASHVVQSMWDGVDTLDVNPRTVLEPSVGNGVFLGMGPVARYAAVEKDNVTSEISRLLYSRARIYHSGFEQIPVEEGNDQQGFDLVIGNPPFGQRSLSDAHNPEFKRAPNVHSFFIQKSLHQLRSGGVGAFVVSRYFLDAVKHEDFREYLARRYHLLGAFRLPNSAFKENAGTEVVTDVLFFQKRSQPIPDNEPFEVPAWVSAGEVLAETEDGPVEGNRYFKENPEHILGELGLTRGMYRDGEPTVVPVEGWEAQLNQATRQLQAAEPVPTQDVPLPRLFEEKIELSQDSEDQLQRAYQGSYVLLEKVSGERFYAVKDNTRASGFRSLILKDSLEHLALPEDHDEKVWTEAELRRLEGFIGVREAVLALLEAQVQDRDDERVTARRTGLNDEYDRYVKAFGYFNRAVNRRLLRHDPHFASVLGLEVNYEREITKAVAKRTGETPRKESADKAPIFFERTQYPESQISSVDDPKEAVLVCINQRGRILPDVIEQLTEKDWEDVRAQLGDDLLLTPGGWELADNYVTGDVVALAESLGRWAQGISADDPDKPEALKTLAAVQAARPALKRMGDFEIIPNAIWVPLEINQAFLDEVLKGDLVLRKDHHGLWDVQGRGRVSDYTTERVTAGRMASALFSQKEIVVRDRTDDGGYVVNEAQTELARARLDMLRERWFEFLTEDSERIATIEKAYNEKVNRFRERKASGMHLTFKGQNQAITMRPHALEAINFFLMRRAALLDHYMGTGKTFTSIAAAAKGKELGLLQKPLFAVPNHLVSQWAGAIGLLFPGKRVLIASRRDMEKKGRQQMLARIAYGDWDFIVMPHSSFSLIPRDPDFEIEFLREQIADFQDGLQWQMENGRKLSVKQQEQALARMKDKLEDLVNESRSGDMGLHWGNLGVDMLATDEAHTFKNVPFYTRMRNIRGLGNPDGAMHAHDYYMKASYLLERNQFVLELTGTPEANSIAEVFLKQMLFAKPELQQLGINSTFDAWAGYFAPAVSEMTFTLTGNLKETTRLSRFVNLDILQDINATYRHIITEEESRQMMRDAGITPPKMPQKAYKVVSVDKTPQQDLIVGKQVDTRHDGMPIYNEGSLLYRADNLPKKPEKGDDNILVIIGEMRRIGLAYHDWAVRKGYPIPEDEPAPKLDAFIEKAMDLYRQWDHERGTQLVFLDFSTPNNSSVSKKKARESKQVAEWVEAMERGLMDEATAAEKEAGEIAEQALEKYSDAEIDDLLKDGMGWSAYEYMREKLVGQGVPAEEIAFIHDYEKDEQKEDLFARVRSGRVRFLFGSTSKMGPGMNVQNRVVGLHNLDAAYRPSDMEQRETRAIRQGNELVEKYDDFELPIFNYVTKGTGDSGLYAILDIKQKALGAVRKRGQMSVEDADAEADFGAVIAAASDNTLIQDMMLVRKEVKRLSAQEQGLRRERDRLASNLVYAKNQVKSFESKKEIIESMAERVDALSQFVLSAKQEQAEQEQKDRHERMELKAKVASIKKKDKEFPFVLVSGNEVLARHFETEEDAQSGLQDYLPEHPGARVAKAKMYPSSLPEIPESQSSAMAWVPCQLEGDESPAQYSIKALGEAFFSAYDEGKRVVSVGTIDGFEFGLDVAGVYSGKGFSHHIYLWDMQSDPEKQCVLTADAGLSSASGTGTRLINLLTEGAASDLRSLKATGKYFERQVEDLSGLKKAGFDKRPELEFLSDVMKASQVLLQEGARHWQQALNKVDELREALAKNPEDSRAKPRLEHLEPLLGSVHLWADVREHGVESLKQGKFVAPTRKDMNLSMPNEDDSETDNENPVMLT